MDLQGQREIAEAFLNEFARSEAVTNSTDRDRSNPEIRERQVLEGFRSILNIGGNSSVRITLFKSKDGKSTISAELRSSFETPDNYNYSHIFNIKTELDRVIIRGVHREYPVSEEEYGGTYHFHGIDQAEQTLIMLNSAIKDAALNPELNEEFINSGISLVDITAEGSISNE